MPDENSRFDVLENGLIIEKIASQIQIFYDPTTQQVRVHFNGTTYLKTGEKYEAINRPNDILTVALNPHITRRMGVGVDPVTGADLSEISIYGVQLLLKKVYDTFHNEHAAAIAETLAAAAAAAQATIDAAAAAALLENPTPP